MNFCQNPPLLITHVNLECFSATCSYQNFCLFLVGSAEISDWLWFLLIVSTILIFVGVLIVVVLKRRRKCRICKLVTHGHPPRQRQPSIHTPENEHSKLDSESTERAPNSPDDSGLSGSPPASRTLVSQENEENAHGSTGDHIPLDKEPTMVADSSTQHERIPLVDTFRSAYQQST